MRYPMYYSLITNRNEAERSRLGRTRKLLAGRQSYYEKLISLSKNVSLHLFSKLSKYFSNYLFIWLFSGYFLTVSLQSFTQGKSDLHWKQFLHFHHNLQAPSYLPL